MKAFDIIKEKGEYFYGTSLCYLVGLENGDEICEIDGSEHYCPECIDSIVKERNEELNRIGYLNFINVHDCSSNITFDNIGYSIQSLPEDDDFCICDNCGCEIQVGVLFTFNQEILYWIDQFKNNSLDIGLLSEQDAYHIYTCITSEDAKDNYPSEVKELKDLIDKIIF